MGAFVAPFMIKDRLPGIDPFQVTMFIWLLVGVVIVAAKSRYVNEWPWHDFLRGRVVCHSVTDLADVTGVDTQLILLKLLHDEYDTVLMTQGPYNGMFTHRTEETDGKFTGGFSIDEPVHRKTLLASGFIVLKALGISGDHLVILDSRKKAFPASINTRSKGEPRLSCIDIPTEKRSGGRLHDVFYVKKDVVEWYKIVGLYDADCVFG